MKRKKIWILVLLVLCCLAFIWGNSVLPGDESGKISSGLFDWLIKTFPALKKVLTTHILRKLGHFSEFAGTAVLASWLFCLTGQKGIHRVTMPMLICLITAVIDETIQIYSPGRASMVTDVWIDLGGACTGIIVFYILYGFAKLLFRRK